MTADIGFNPQITQPNQQPVQQSEQLSRDDMARNNTKSESSRSLQKQAADVAQLSNQAIKRQAESGGISPESRVDFGRLNQMQNNLDAIEQKVRGIKDTADKAVEGKLSGEEMSRYDAQVGRDLEDVDKYGAEIASDSSKLQVGSAPVASKLQIVVNTEDLGRLEIVPGESITMSDVKPQGRASVNNDPMLAAKVAEKALEDLSVMRTEVANVASAVSGYNVPGVEGNLLNGNSASRIAQELVGNVLNNPGALLEAASGISTGNALSLLSN